MTQDPLNNDELVKKDIKSWAALGLSETEIFQRICDKYPNLRWQMPERIAFR